MKRSTIVILCIAAGVIAISGGVAAGVTFAGYTQSKTYTFNSNSESITVRDIAHYFAGGTGADANHAYQITSPTHLRNLAKLNNAGFILDGTFFRLENSFNWSGDPMEPIGSTTTHAWKSFFDGNCRTISGLKVEAKGTFAGMFGIVDGSSAGMVKNICLSSPVIDCIPTSPTSVSAGFIAGKVNNNSNTKTVSGIIVYGGNENSVDGSSRVLVERATIKANANATVTSTAGTSQKSLIVGATVNNNNLGKVSFVAHMGDIVISGSDFDNPTGGASNQNSVKFSGVPGAFTYEYYRKTNGDMYQVP